MRILYVEDNPANVYLVKRVANAGQHEVINYVDGGRVLRDFDQINPDLVLMDIQLVGELSGIDVVKKLRSDGHQVPIIAVTAYAMMGDKDRCMAAGCDDYMAKPLPIPELLQMFSKYGTQATKPASDPEADTVVPLPARKPSDPDPSENTVRMAPISPDMLSKLDSTPGPIAAAEDAQTDEDTGDNEDDVANASTASPISESEETSEEATEEITEGTAVASVSTTDTAEADENEAKDEDDDDTVAPAASSTTGDLD